MFSRKYLKLSRRRLVEDDRIGLYLCELKLVFLLAFLMVWIIILRENWKGVNFGSVAR